MAFDYNGAKQDGYSDVDILDNLKKTRPDFDYSGAMGDNYSVQEIADHLNKTPPKRQAAQPPQVQQPQKPYTPKPGDIPVDLNQPQTRPDIQALVAGQQIPQTDTPIARTVPPPTYPTVVNKQGNYNLSLPQQPGDIQTIRSKNIAGPAATEIVQPLKPEVSAVTKTTPETIPEVFAGRESGIRVVRPANAALPPVTTEIKPPEPPPEVKPEVVATVTAKVFLNSWNEFERSIMDVGRLFPEGSARVYDAIGMIPGKPGEFFQRQAENARIISKQYHERTTELLPGFEFTDEEKNAQERVGMAGAQIIGTAQLIAFISQIALTRGMNVEGQFGALKNAFGSFAAKYGADALVKAKPLLEKAADVTERVVTNMGGAAEVAAANTPGTLKEKIKAGVETGAFVGGGGGVSIGVAPLIRGFSKLTQRALQGAAQAGFWGGTAELQGQKPSDVLFSTGLGAFFGLKEKTYGNNDQLYDQARDTYEKKGDLTEAEWNQLKPRLNEGRVDFASRIGSELLYRRAKQVFGRTIPNVPWEDLKARPGELLDDYQERLNSTLDKIATKKPEGLPAPAAGPATPPPAPVPKPTPVPEQPPVPKPTPVPPKAPPEVLPQGMSTLHSLGIGGPDAFLTLPEAQQQEIYPKLNSYERNKVDDARKAQSAKTIPHQNSNVSIGQLNPKDPTSDYRIITGDYARFAEMVIEADIESAVKKGWTLKDVTDRMAAKGYGFLTKKKEGGYAVGQIQFCDYVQFRLDNPDSKSTFGEWRKGDTYAEGSGGFTADVPGELIPKKNITGKPTTPAEPQVDQAMQETQQMPVVPEEGETLTPEEFNRLSPEAQKAEYERVLKQTEMNQVTQRPGIQHFKRTFKKATENYTKPVWVAQGDINGFKEYNDRILGSSGTDDLNRTIYDRIASTDRSLNVSNIHGDEYIITGSTKDQLEKNIKKAMEDIAAAGVKGKDGKNYKPTMSWKIAQAKDLGEVGNINAKEAGKNQIVVENQPGKLYTISGAESVKPEEIVRRQASNENAVSNQVLPGEQTAAPAGDLGRRGPQDRGTGRETALQPQPAGTPAEPGAGRAIQQEGAAKPESVTPKSLKEKTPAFIQDYGDDPKVNRLIYLRAVKSQLRKAILNQPRGQEQWNLLTGVKTRNNKGVLITMTDKTKGLLEEAAAHGYPVTAPKVPPPAVEVKKETAPAATPMAPGLPSTDDRARIKKYVDEQVLNKGKAIYTPTVIQGGVKHIRLDDGVGNEIVIRKDHPVAKDIEARKKELGLIPAEETLSRGRPGGEVGKENVIKNQMEALVFDRGFFYKKQITKDVNGEKKVVWKLTNKGGNVRYFKLDDPRMKLYDQAIDEFKKGRRTPEETPEEETPAVSAIEAAPAETKEGEEFGWKEAGFATEKDFVDSYNKNGMKDVGETREEYLQRVYCKELMGGQNTFSIKEAA